MEGYRQAEDVVHPRIMLILTAQLSSEAEENLQWLAAQLDVPRAGIVDRSFSISTEEEGDWEFAVIGFRVAPQRLPTSD